MTIMTLITEEQLANRRAWLAALRSGNYRQARRALRRGNAFCCLGVAEDVVDCRWQEIDIPGDPSSHRALHPTPRNIGTDTSLTSLTVAARERLGVKLPVPYVAHWTNARDHRHWDATSLVNLNDTLRLTLDQIADVIEDQDLSLWNGTRTQALALASARNRNGDRPAGALAVH